MSSGNESIDDQSDYERNWISTSSPSPSPPPPPPPPPPPEDAEVVGANGALQGPVIPGAFLQSPFYGFEDDVEGVEVEIEAEPTYDDKDMSQVLQIWEAKQTTNGFDPVPALKRLAEIFEKETDIYMRKDPDPFEGRHPYRVDPSCQFGYLLKQLFRKDLFMIKLVNDYLRDNYFTRQNIQKSSLELNIIACRLILGIMPGLEISAVFQVGFDNPIHRIYTWAEDSIEPLQSYATGMLASAMEVTEIAVMFREQNSRLVPKMIKRLHMLQVFHKSNGSTASPSQDAKTSQPPAPENHDPSSIDCIIPPWMGGSAPQSPQRQDDHSAGDRQNNGTLDSFPNTSNMSTFLESSRDGAASSAARYYKKMFIPIHPPTAETTQMLILKYLTSMGEYQEFLGLVFENCAMQLIFGYIKNLDSRDTCLAFEALKYLASLLCHKKFSLEFIAHGGLEMLLKVPRPSIAATGVSITLYYLSYTEDAMERICTMPKSVIKDLVHYALWILGRSYDSGKCHATMFFGLSFQFKVILDEFDAQDGLRKLHNVISILKIVNPSNNEVEEENSLNEDVECAQRQLVRHVCVALKRYMESHLFFKYNNFMYLQCPSSTEYARNVPRAAKATLEQISDQIRTLQEHTSVRACWTPVDQLIKLGGITLLLKIIAFSYEWNNSGRSETVRSALDVLNICCVIPKVYLVYCENLDLPDNGSTSGLNYILGAASGDITTDAEVQKSALAVICHCVCAPIPWMESIVIKCFGSSRKNKQHNKNMEELIEKVWESVCSNNGIILLLSLMQIKAPITDADCIRGMACRALAGLARSERVRQIISKLPLFASGQIHTLMRDPILQEKRAEHVLFQKYGLELLERVSGKAKPFNNQLDPTLANLHKANVIAQTKIQYNEQQLNQLIYYHLESKGLKKAAQMLQMEAGLQLPAPNVKNFHQSPFDYKELPISSIARNRLRNRMQDVSLAINNICTVEKQQQGAQSSEEQQQQQPPPQHSGSNISITPIKLVKKYDKTSNVHVPLNPAPSTSSSSQRSLQKKISSLVDNSPSLGSPPPRNSITLGTIVTEYLTNQHALCNNPMTTCPQFDLFIPHKCPDPKPNRALGTDLNLTTRVFRAQAGYNTSRLDCRYVHSNFAPWRTIRSNDHSDIQFNCCDIVHSSNDLILVGTQQGVAKAFRISDGVELYSGDCHNYLIDSIKSNRQGDLVLTSCSWREPLSTLWCTRNKTFASQLRFNDEFHLEFSNLAQDKILGTQNDCATIYDIPTGVKLTTFTPKIANQYTKNRATFCPTDELILSDGVLWDVRSAKEIHKFDKLNQTLSGVFHPNNLEIISNTEVWDLRTFHLLQNVQVLDQCYVRFSPMRVMYGVSLDIENRTDYDDTDNYVTSFKVLDAYDYSSISTIDVKRNIYDMSVNVNGSLIAMIENQPTYDSKQETYVKIYAVGVKRSEQEEEDDEDRDSDEDGSDSDTTDTNEIRLPGQNRRNNRNANGEDNDDDNGDSNDEDMDEDDDDLDDEDDDDDEMSDDDDDGWIDLAW